MKTYRTISLLAVVVVISVFLFYWYEYRPANIRKKCSETQTGFGLSALGQPFNEDRYKSCLHRYGL